MRRKEMRALPQFQGVLRVVHQASPRLLLVTAGSLTGSMVLGAVFAAAFWWLATKLYTPHTIGVAVASLSAMALVASLCMVGAGTLLIRELHRPGAQMAALIGTATITAGTVAAIAGALFAIAAPAINPDLRDLATNPLTVGIFAAGVALTSVAIVLDEVLLGLLRARLRLVRNLVFNVGKIVLLVAVSLLVAGEQPVLVYGVWTAGVLISFLVLAPLVARSRRPRPLFSWVLLREMMPGAVSNQALNTALDLPAIGIPVAVSLLVRPEQTAQFYIAFMLASVSFYAPHALSQTLYAVGSRSADQLWEHTRVTAALSMAIGIAAVVGMVLFATPILSLFGPQYVSASGFAPLLAAVSIPIVIKDHFSVVFRIQRREVYAFILCTLGAVAELAGAVIGLLSGGLVGLAVGWLIAVLLEALLMGPPLLHAVRQRQIGAER